MMKNRVSRMLSVLLALMMLIGAVPAAKAQTADYAALVPLMDLVSAASSVTAGMAETIPGEEGALSPSFAKSFFSIGQLCDPQLGITAEMLTDTSAQAEYLSRVFAAQIPALEPAEEPQESFYTGFQPVTVTPGADGSVLIVGEIYFAPRSMRVMEPEEYMLIEWLDRAAFTFRKDASALNGYRLTGFSVGMDLSMEEAFMAYDQQILVEYESKLGFMVLYPSFFTDEMLSETKEGITAALPDGSVSFFARRTENVNRDSLSDYVSLVANGLPGSASTVEEVMKYGTIAHITADGFFVFDVYSLTDDYIYQAQLKYPVSRLAELAMYNAYLENSFVISGISQG